MATGANLTPSPTTPSPTPSNPQTLTGENYFSPESNMAYMSASQFKGFSSCEAAALAELRGDYTRPESTALLVGGYIDAHFEGTLDLYRAKHPEMYKRDGGLKSEYIKAEEAIARAERDELFMALMAGRKQVVVAGIIGGVPFKGKIDSLLDEGQIMALCRDFPELTDYLTFRDGLVVDLKYMRDFEDTWDDDAHQRVPFAQKWGYHYQGAIYTELAEQSLGITAPFAIAGITKEDEPDIEAFILSEDDLQSALYEIEDAAPLYQAIKEGREPASRCEKCAYCRATKTLSRFKEISLC